MARTVIRPIRFTPKEKEDEYVLMAAERLEPAFTYSDIVRWGALGLAKDLLQDEAPDITSYMGLDTGWLKARTGTACNIMVDHIRSFLGLGDVS